MVDLSKYVEKISGTSGPFGIYAKASTVIKVEVGLCKKAVSETGPAFSGRLTYKVV